MAEFIETAVNFVIQIEKQGDGSSRVTLNGASRTADGFSLRSTNEDVTAIIPADLQPSVDSLMAAAEAYLKGKWNIP